MTELRCPRCGGDLDEAGEVKEVEGHWVCEECYDDLKPWRPEDLR